MDVHLTPQEIEYCERVSRTWNLNLRDRVMDPAQAYRLGILGEYATAKHLRLPVQFEVKETGDDGHDLLMGGWRLQVKTTNKPTNRLIFNNPDHFNSEIAILVYWREQTATATIKGWIDRVSFDKAGFPFDCNGKERWTVANESLRPIPLLEVVRSCWQTGHFDLKSHIPRPSTSGHGVSDEAVPF